MRTASDGGAGGQVQITIEEIVAIARQHLPATEDDAATATRGLRDLALDPSSFSEVPLAQELAAQHEAAHGVFVGTIDGVLQDLRDFAATLGASAQAHQENDEAVAATLTSFTQVYEAGTSHAQENFDRLRQEEGERLRVDPDEAPADPTVDPTMAPPVDPAAAPDGGDGRALGG